VAGESTGESETRKAANEKLNPVLRLARVRSKSGKTSGGVATAASRLASVSSMRARAWLEGWYPRVEMGEEMSSDGGERPGGRVSPGGWTGASSGFDGMERPGGRLRPGDSGIGALVGIDAESSKPMALGVARGDDMFEVVSARVPAGTGIETKVDLEGGLSEGVEGLEALGAGIVCSLRSFPRPFDSADALRLVFCRVRSCRPDRITGPGGPSWIVCPDIPAGAAPPDADVCDVATCWVRVAHEAVRGSVGATYS